MTVHQAKGLEFDAVFVIGMVRSSFPGSDRGGVDIPDALLPEVLPRGRDAHVAEARRLAYVAMTRARRHLVLAAFGGQRSRGPARPPRPSSRRPARRRAPSWRTSARRPSGPCWRASAERHAAFEQASLRAASAVAAGEGDAPAPRRRGRGGGP